MWPYNDATAQKKINLLLPVWTVTEWFEASDLYTATKASMKHCSTQRCLFNGSNSYFFLCFHNHVSIFFLLLLHSLTCRGQCAIAVTAWKYKGYDIIAVVVSADPGFSPIPGSPQELLKVPTAKLSCYFLISIAELILISWREQFCKIHLFKPSRLIARLKRRRILSGPQSGSVLPHTQTEFLISSGQTDASSGWLFTDSPLRHQNFPLTKEMTYSRVIWCVFGFYCANTSSTCIHRVSNISYCDQNKCIFTKIQSSSFLVKLRVPWLETVPQPQKLFDSPLACTDWDWRLLIIAPLNYCWLILLLEIKQTTINRHSTHAYMVSLYSLFSHDICIVYIQNVS